jgi:hypothetical protein
VHPVTIVPDEAARRQQQAAGQTKYHPPTDDAVDTADDFVLDASKTPQAA